MKTRSATAVWKGGLKDGNGDMNTESGVIKDLPYNFARRFESEPGTNPEELIAAAHAGCFSMAFSANLGKENMTPEYVKTKGTVTFEQTDAGWSLSKSHLDVSVKVVDGDRDMIVSAAEAAKTGCPVARALNMTITMDLNIED